MSTPCQVDFYQLESAKPGPRHLACRLALMAWERGHRVAIMVADENQAKHMDQLLWSFPEGRFIPHGRSGSPEATGAPVIICQRAPRAHSAVLINLTAAAIDDFLRFERLIEIVPFETRERSTARTKYKAYKTQGAKLGHHKIN